MTAASFNAYIEETAPHIVTASHYDLAPDVYGLDDGYAWAFATVSRTEALANADSATSTPTTPRPACPPQTRARTTPATTWRTAANGPTTSPPSRRQP